LDPGERLPELDLGEVQVQRRAGAVTPLVPIVERQQLAPREVGLGEATSRRSLSISANHPVIAVFLP
jgi:hypothetical protein